MRTGTHEDLEWNIGNGGDAVNDKGHNTDLPDGGTNAAFLDGHAAFVKETTEWLAGTTPEDRLWYH